MPIKKSGFAYEEFDDEDKQIDQAVDAVLHSKVIGWYRGRFEWGPRALGHRSIMADPRREEMKEVVNTKIKFREPFRPFAPVVLEERAEEYYVGLTDATRFRLSVTTAPGGCRACERSGITATTS